MRFTGDNAAWIVVVVMAALIVSAFAKHSRHHHVFDANGNVAEAVR